MAVVASTVTSLSAILKQNYLSPDKIKDVQVDSGPLLAELLGRADTSAGGKTIPFPLIQASGGGVGSQYNAAFAGTQPANSVVFQLTRSTAFGVLQLGAEVLIASEGIENSFISDMVLEFDAKRRRLAQYMATSVYGDGLGQQGQISLGQTTTSTTLTLEDPATAVHFQVGDAIQISATYGGANRTAGTGTAVTLTNGPSTYTGVAYVVGVNLVGANAGTIQVAHTPGGAAEEIVAVWSAVAAGDYICLVGDANAPTNSLGSGPAIIQGIVAWAGGWAGVASTGDSFFGQNRYGSSFLTCQLVDATANTGGLNSGSIREALTQGVAQLHAVSARPDMIVMHPTAWFNLSLSLQSQGMYPGRSGQGPSDTGSLGFSSLEMPTEFGMIRVLADPMCVPTLNATYFSPANGYSGSSVAFILESDTWEVVAISEDGQVPFLEKKGTDGNGLAQVVGQDILFASLKAYLQLGSHAPGHNIVMLLPNS